MTTQNIQQAGTTTVTTLCGVKVFGRVDMGFGGIPYGTYEVLTECCEAAVTGTVEGLACKGCYQLIDEAVVGGSRYAIEAAAEAKGCPCPLDCADHTLWAIDRELGLLD